MATPRTLTAILLAAAAAACASPPPLTRAEMTEPALLRIHDAFLRTVREAREDPDVDWKSGWWGNIGVHLSGRDTRGLCYEWQGLVHRGVRSTVASVGWSVTGVNVNQGTASEHHAVLVWDPRRVRRKDLLPDGAPGKPAYVLDGWQRGEADVYTLEAWLDMPFWTRVGPRLERPYPGVSNGGGE